MKNQLLFLMFLFCFCSCNKQVNQRASKAPLDFPNDWIGSWKGDLIITNADGQQAIPMRLEIYPTASSDTLDFTIIYLLNEKVDRRAYLLIELDKERGKYIIDEQNSIRLEASLLNGHLLQSFEVMGNLIQSDIYLQDGFLHYEIIFGTSRQAKTTGGEVIEQDTIPTVSSFPILATQVAKLSRVARVKQ